MQIEVFVIPATCTHATEQCNICIDATICKGSCAVVEHTCWSMTALTSSAHLHPLTREFFANFRIDGYGMVPSAR